MTGERRAALRARLREAELDALLVTRLVNVRYLTGFTGNSGTLLVTADGDGDLFVTDGRYTGRAASEVVGLTRLEARGTDWVAERLGGRERLGVEGHDLSWDAVRALVEALAKATDGRVQVVPAERHVEALRAAKEPGEVMLLARACTIGDAAFASLCEWMAPGMTERAVALRLETDMLALGADAVGFPTIVASGPNGADPHHTPGDRHLCDGDLVTLDFGARLDGYHSDMTRTVALGVPSEHLERLYELVLAAQLAGVEALADDVEVGVVDAACRDVIAAGDLGPWFVHPTGHALGLEIHEEPVLRAGGTARLRTCMAVTVEPGVYVSGLGGVRIEDTVVVGSSPQDAAVLTHSPKDLLVL